MFWKLQDDILEKNDIEYLVKFIRSTKRYTQFDKVKLFEAAWSKWQGSKYSVFVNSGSSANLILLSAMKEIYNWKDEDEIIVSSVTWITNISPVIQLGLRPIFVDINLNDLSFDYEQLENSITSKTKAIFVTHLIGVPADINRIKNIIGDRKIHILEDTCESHGATIGNKKVGNFGSGSTFSYYWGHHMTTIEGGMICTDNEELYHACLLKRSHGLARELPVSEHNHYKEKYPNMDFSFLFLTNGYNMRNTELHATLGLSQLKKLDRYIQIRNENYKMFINICKDYLQLYPTPNKLGISSYCLPFIFKSYNLKVKFQKLLANNDIEFRPLISGNLLNQPVFKTYKKVSHKMINADFIDKNAFYVGNNQFVDSKRINVLSNILHNFFDPKITYANIQV